jgi:aminoglycoside 3-N-acetyltransferase
MALDARQVMVSHRSLLTALQDLGLTRRCRVIAHVSLASLGREPRHTESVLGALLETCGTLVLPAFTPQTLVGPAEGAGTNGPSLPDGPRAEARAESFHPDMPSDSAMGEVVECLRRMPGALRSDHPLLSFTGMNAAEALQRQSLEDPWGPIAWLSENDGDVLLAGMAHSANVSLHYAEKLAGRKQFLRRAQTAQGVVACPGCPGCSDGFKAIEPRLAGVARRYQLGGAMLQLIPLRDLIHVAVSWIRQDPRALLCDRLGCAHCSEVRAAVRLED